MSLIDKDLFETNKEKDQQLNLKNGQRTSKVIPQETKFPKTYKKLLKGKCKLKFDASFLLMDWPNIL